MIAGPGRIQIDGLDDPAGGGCQYNDATTEVDARPTKALAKSEIRVLDHLARHPVGEGRRRRTPSHDLDKLGRLGGYLIRASDPPPGNVVMWRGLSRLTEIQIGVEIGAGDLGNSECRAPLVLLLMQSMRDAMRR